MRQHLVLIALLDKLQQPEIILQIPILVEKLGEFVHTDIDAEIRLELIAELP